jgi:hypothetical protein
MSDPARLATTFAKFLSVGELSARYRPSHFIAARSYFGDSFSPYR